MEPVSTSYEAIAPAALAAQQATRVPEVPTTAEAGSNGSDFHPGRDRSQAALVTAGLLSAETEENEEPPAPQTIEAETEAERVLKPYGITMLPHREPE